MAAWHHDTESLIERVHTLDREIAARQRELLETLAELETRQTWIDDGAHDMAQWTSMHLDVSRWKAERWLHAGRAFSWLPATADALGRGELGIDKVVELARFAEFDDEDALVRWAQTVPSGAIRRAGELRAKERADEAEHDERTRWLQWRYDDGGRRFLLDAELPSAQGAVVARALDRLGEQIPVTPGEESPAHAGARRADALFALCSARLARDEDQDRATVVVHADLEVLYDDDTNAVIEGGPVIAGPTVQRLLCNARVQMVVEQPDGSVAGVGRMSREPTAWMMRQLRHRDGGCRFPAATPGGSRRLTTSNRGRAAVRPISTIWHWSARSITSSCTNTGGRSSEPTAAASCGIAPEGPAIAPGPLATTWREAGYRRREARLPRSDHFRCR